MVDPRIYRMGLVPLVLAVIVLAFSLGNQAGGVGTTLAPDAYNGQNAYATASYLATRPQFRHRTPGSPGDGAIASYVARKLSHYGFSVSRQRFSAGTVAGPRTLENVVGVRAGSAIIPGTIAVVAHRDSSGSSAPAELGATGVLLELARLLQGETQHHTIVLASTSGSVGAAGADQLAHWLPRPVDAVLVLGDLAAKHVRQPVVVPWSDGQQVAPPQLRNTVSTALAAQAGVVAGANGLGGQIAHLAFPMTPSEQAPFGSAGEPALLISASSDRSPPPGETLSPSRVIGMGRAVLTSLNALDNGPAMPSPSTYLLWSGKVVPAWAIQLLVLALIAPVAAATVDAVARARRRRLPVLRWMGWILATASPFLAAFVLVALARVIGLIGFAPSLPVPAGAVALGASGIAVLAVLGLVILGGLIWLTRRLVFLTEVEHKDQPRGAPAAGAPTALLTLLSLTVFIAWLANPFAALLTLPALHCWMWAVAVKRRLPLPAIGALLLAGLALPGLVAFYYAVTLGVSPIGWVWSLVLLLAGGGIGWTSALMWSVFAGCAVSAAIIALRVAREPAAEASPITIRGPITYAGPGSLGGTRSALRR